MRPYDEALHSNKRFDILSKETQGNLAGVRMATAFMFLVEPTSDEVAVARELDNLDVGEEIEGLTYTITRVK